LVKQRVTGDTLGKNRRGPAITLLQRRKIEVQGSGGGAENNPDGNRASKEQSVGSSDHNRANCAEHAPKQKDRISGHGRKEAYPQRRKENAGSFGGDHRFNPTGRQEAGVRHWGVSAAGGREGDISPSRSGSKRGES